MTGRGRRPEPGHEVQVPGRKDLERLPPPRNARSSEGAGVPSQFSGTLLAPQGRRQSTHRSPVVCNHCPFPLGYTSLRPVAPGASRGLCGPLRPRRIENPSGGLWRSHHAHDQSDRVAWVLWKVFTRDQDAAQEGLQPGPARWPCRPESGEGPRTFDSCEGTTPGSHQPRKYTHSSLAGPESRLL